MLETPLPQAPPYWTKRCFKCLNVVREAVSTPQTTCVSTLGMTWRHKKFHLSIRRTSSHWGRQSTGTRCPGWSLESPPLEIFQTHVDAYPCHLLEVRMPWQGGWTRWSWESSPTLTILWFRELSTLSGECSCCSPVAWLGTIHHGWLACGLTELLCDSRSLSILFGRLSVVYWL